MDVRDFMTPDPLTIPPDARLSEARQRMDDCVVRHLPVVRGRTLLGVLSDRDLLDLSPDELASSRVEALMHSPVTIAPDDPVVNAACELILGRIGCLPVLEDEVLVGILSEFDVLRLYVRVCREGGRVGELDPPVERIATTKLTHVAPDGTLDEVRALMTELGVRHMPVLQGDRAVGILSDRDVRRATGRGAPGTLAVRELMSTPVLVARPDEPLSAVVERMAEHKISAMVVCAGGGDQVQGIVTLTDVLDHGLETLRDPDLV